MKKPLWTFFTLLKARTQLLLSVDQYAYFLAAFQQIPTGHFKNYHDLRDFCKIFWLKDQEYEADFDLLFEQIAVWEDLKLSFLEPEEEPSPEEPGKGTDAGGTPSTGGGSRGGGGDQGPGQKTNGQEVQDDDSTGKQIEEEELAEIELTIKEQDQNAGQTARAAAYQFEYTFTLNDQAIMPFELRHFAQRLRREVETPVKVPTKDLDYEQMIIQYTKYRYIDEIVYQFRDSSSSNIVLLADRYGSMLAYEYVEKQLYLAINTIPDCSFEHYFYYNLPERQGSENYLLKNAGKGKPQLDTGKHKWNTDTWFFILSDAGAHSGMVNRGRMVDTFRWWNYLRGISSHVYWLNPVPPDYLQGSTAQRLKVTIPMIYPTKDELKKFFQNL
ncbi:MAG: hypothetical protein R2824_33870 [Saprospiraceae bacterium]|nr:hypothetical protein [Lewinella sp.]